MPLDNNANISDVINSLQNLQGINQKTELASVIGSPTTTSDNIATQITNLQNAKNTLATKVGLPNTTPIQQMVDNVFVGKRWASGTLISSAANNSVMLYDGSTFNSVRTVDFNAGALPFTPSTILLYTKPTTISVAIWSSEEFREGGNHISQTYIYRIPYKSVMQLPVNANANVEVYWIAYE